MAAVSLGFLGSFHCIGMCGPIALALPLGKKSQLGRMLRILFYNAGRMVTYGVFGLFFGLLGKSVVISGYQQTLSIILGVIILCSVVLPSRITSRYGIAKMIMPVVAKVKFMLGNLFTQTSFSSFFSIGILNGFLPCGLVYLGVSGAIATGDTLKGAWFMLLFGLGTLPAMITVALVRNLITLEWRNRIHKAIPVVVVAMACVFILRGLNLGLPYISPKFSETDCTKQNCCYKK